MSQKPVGTLVIDDLNLGTSLYLLATGTGLAPFLSIIKDPDVYERFANIKLIHCVRKKEDLAYFDYLTSDLREDEYIGSHVAAKFKYIPTVTREPFKTTGRITQLIENRSIDLDPLSDRVMLCGSQSMLKDVSQLLNSRGFKVSSGQGSPGDYVVERAFAE